MFYQLQLISNNKYNFILQILQNFIEFQDIFRNVLYTVTFLYMRIKHRSNIWTENRKNEN